MNKKVGLLLLLLAGLSLLPVACRAGTDSAPTPFPTATSMRPTLPGVGPFPVSAVELTAAPGLYQDALLQVSGLLRRQPRLVCSADPRPSPATWALADGGAVALAGGFDEQVRALLPDDLAMTVEGRWRRWQGPVGCGKNARTQEVWYLEVSRILSPSPLAQITLTPAGVAALPEETAPVVGLPTLEATPTLEPSGDDFFSPTPEDQSGDDFFATPEITPTFTFTETTPFSVTATLSATSTITLTPDLNATPTPTPGGTPSPTPSGTPPTAAPTVTGTPPTPTATTPSGTPTVVDQGEYDYGTIVGAILAANTIHGWDFELIEDEVLLGVSAIAPIPADLTLAIYDEDGQVVIAESNQSPAGSVESLVSPNLPGEGVYSIRVGTESGQATEYSLAVYSDFTESLIFNGLLQSGVPRSNINIASDTYHYWHFVGQAGDVVSVTVTPMGDREVEFSLYLPLAEYDDSYYSESPGQPAEMIDFTLDESGLYAIEVLSSDSDPLNYNISLTIE